MRITPGHQRNPESRLSGYPDKVRVERRRPKPDLLSLARWEVRRRELDADGDRRVLAARIAGATWQEIGAHLGLARQSAWERFHHLEGAARPDLPPRIRRRPIASPVPLRLLDLVAESDAGESFHRAVAALAESDEEVDRWLRTPNVELGAMQDMSSVLPMKSLSGDVLRSYLMTQAANRL